MHLANTPVVSPESKSPDWRGSRHNQIVASHRCHRCAALPSINTLAKFLARFQLCYLKIALKAKIYICDYSDKSFLEDRKTFALKISRHQRTRFLASPSVSQGAIPCNSLVMSEIFFRVV